MKGPAHTVSPAKKVGQTGGSAADNRPFILMKNKVEENSKQLKQDVAQQIIAASSRSG